MKSCSLLIRMKVNKMATMNRDMREALTRSIADREAALAASLSAFRESRGLAQAATDVAASGDAERISRMAAGLRVPEGLLTGLTGVMDGYRPVGPFTSTPERAPNPFFDPYGVRDDSVGTEAAVREGRRMGVAVPTLDTNGMTEIPAPTPPQGFARNTFTPEAAAEAQMRAAEYFRTGGATRTVTLGQNVQPGDLVGIATGAGGSGGVGGAYDFRVRDGAGITVNPWSEVTVARKPSMTMDEAISTLLQKISDALPQNASSEYNDAVSDVLEVVEAFRVTQIEPPKVENSKYQDILRQLGSRVITDIVKEVILAYRYSKLEDKDLLANLKAALNNSLRGRVSENTVVTSVHTHVDNINLQRVVQVRFKLHKDDDLIHTQEISMNVNF